jgi:preprotein translocase subunit YajC
MIKLDFINKIKFVKDMSPTQRKIVVLSTAVLTVAGIATATYFVVKNHRQKKKESSESIEKVETGEEVKKNEKKIENK